MHAPTAPTEHGAPRKQIAPILPLLDWRPFSIGSNLRVPSVLNVGSPILVTRGADAIRLALRRIATALGDEVLVPAFHCPSMVKPILAEGAQPVFYRISENLAIGLEHIEPHVNARTRAILVPHLFNRLQDLRSIRTFCDERGIALIEDCAHALFGSVGGSPVGSRGHFAIASPRKFLPLEEGGLLTSAIDDLNEIRLQVPSRGRSLRLVFDAVDRATSYGRLRGLRPAVDLVKLAGRAARRTQNAEAPPSESASPKDDFGSPGRASRFTRWTMPHLISETQLRKRSDHYFRLSAAIADCTSMRVLTNDPYDHFVPYVVPILLEDPDRQFDRLKQLGVPMWRWEYSKFGVCPVSDWFSRALIQIPCHQSLRAAELDAIIAALRSVGGSRRE